MGAAPGSCRGLTVATLVIASVVPCGFGKWGSPDPDWSKEPKRHEKDDPSVATVRLINNFDLHLDRFASAVGEETRRREQAWLRMASELDQVIARLDLPLSQDETDEVEASSPLPDIFDEPEVWTTTTSLTLTESEAVEEMSDSRNSEESTAGSDVGDDEGAIVDDSSQVNENSDLGVDGGVEKAMPDDISDKTNTARQEPRKPSTSSVPSAPIPPTPKPAGHAAISSSEASSSSSSRGISRRPPPSSVSEDPTLNFECRMGQGERQGWLKVTGDNDEAACARQCNSDVRCQSFDYMLNPQSDACRLYASDAPPRANTGAGHRKLCHRKLSGRSSSSRSPATTATKPSSSAPRVQVKPKLTQKGVEYYVTLQKEQPRDKWGLKVFAGANNIGLQIAKINGGLVSQWNDAHQESALHPGDTIVEINGHRGDSSNLIELFKRERKINLVLKREDGHAKEPALAPEKDATEQIANVVSVASAEKVASGNVEAILSGMQMSGDAAASAVSASASVANPGSASSTPGGRISAASAAAEKMPTASADKTQEQAPLTTPEKAVKQQVEDLAKELASKQKTKPLISASAAGARNETKIVV